MQFNPLVSFIKVASLIFLSFFIANVSFSKGQKIYPLTIISKPQALEQCQMISSDNVSFTNQNFLEHWTLLTFGYINSPHICPENMSMLSNVYKKLSPTYSNLQVVMVTIDPQRDTSDRLKQYMTMFNKNFIGATGDSNELSKLKKQLGIQVSHNNSKHSTEEFKTNYSKTVFLIDPKGQFFAMLTLNNTNEIANNFEKAVNMWNSKYQ
jgi:protein SCO1